LRVFCFYTLSLWKNTMNRCLLRSSALLFDPTPLGEQDRPQTRRCEPSVIASEAWQSIVSSQKSWIAALRSQ